MAGATLPVNQLELSLSEVARITGGKLVGNDAKVRGVRTDTRAELSGALFLALAGERFDAHDYVSQARERGAAGLLVERAVETTLPYVLVSSTLEALGALGAARRASWGGKVVAVAGSAGKTTTRAAISALLEQVEPQNVHFARGNFNNLIGVPIVLLSLEREQLAVVELGTNRPGEVAALTQMAKPDVAVLTLIGYEHTEGLGDLDGVEAEEGALFTELGSGKVAVGNVDDERVARQLARFTGRKLGYGTSDSADYRLRVLHSSAQGSELEVGRTLGGRNVTTRLRISTLGDAGAYAACAALAAVEAVLGREIGSEACTAAFASALASEAGRLHPVELTGGILLIDDTYNSNPESLRSSLKTARRIADDRGAP
jgi:UDP-N-acetylmuramoyl-tripeptide--D-alanyl-D-alanine ligase